MILASAAVLETFHAYHLPLPYVASQAFFYHAASHHSMPITLHLRFCLLVTINAYYSLALTIMLPRKGYLAFSMAQAGQQGESFDAKKVMAGTTG